MEHRVDWYVKSYWYAVVCISDKFHGTGVIWKTEEEAWEDIEGRVENFFEDENERKHFYSKKVEDGYEIRNKSDNQIVICYKIFDTQELECQVN